MALPKKLNKDQERLWAKAQLYRKLNVYRKFPCCASCNWAKEFALAGSVSCESKPKIMFFVQLPRLNLKDRDDNDNWEASLLHMSRTELEVGLCDKWFKNEVD